MRDIFLSLVAFLASIIIIFYAFAVRHVMYDAIGMIAGICAACTALAAVLKGPAKLIVPCAVIASFLGVIWIGTIAERKAYACLRAIVSGDIGEVQRCMEEGQYTGRDLLQWTPLTAVFRLGYDRGELYHRSQVKNMSKEEQETVMVAMIEILLHDSRIDLDEKDYNRMAPLHYAASRGLPRVTKLLIRHGADLNVRDYDGRTPLEVAIELKRDTVAEILRDAESKRRGDRYSHKNRDE